MSDNCNRCGKPSKKPLCKQCKKDLAPPSFLDKEISYGNIIAVLAWLLAQTIFTLCLIISINKFNTILLLIISNAVTLCVAYYLGRTSYLRRMQKAIKDFTSRNSPADEATTLPEIYPKPTKKQPTK